ncbi:PET domain-containing protein [Phthorimaea operculella]|nr:PET domain-containing protein [Phthorimaea operculella]
MLCLSRHEGCPWDEALKDADQPWTGLQYSCLKILHLYCKVFEKEDILDLVIRKTCKECGCDRLAHAVYHEELDSVRARLGLRETRPRSGHDVPGLTAKQTELYYSALAERAPTGIGGATGAAAWRAWRTRALANQLPKQDLSLAHCRHLDEEHKKQFEDFVAARNEIALDIGVASQHHERTSIECMGCTKAIRTGSIMIQAPRIAEDAYFHPACFTCSECDELLVELAYCALDGRLYCVRHYAERLKPRCHACDEVSFGIFRIPLFAIFIEDQT